MMTGLVIQLTSFYGLNMSIYYNYSNLSIVCALFYMIGFGMGLGCSMYAYIPEILPPAGVGLVMMFKWGCITTSAKFIPLIIDKYGLNWTINIFLSKFFQKNL